MLGLRDGISGIDVLIVLRLLVFIDFMAITIIDETNRTVEHFHGFWHCDGVDLPVHL